MSGQRKDDKDVTVVVTDVSSTVIEVKVHSTRGDSAVFRVPTKPIVPMRYRSPSMLEPNPR